MNSASQPLGGDANTAAPLHRAWSSLAHIGEAAAIASLITKSALHPIDTVKIRLQSEKFTSLAAFFQRWRGAWGPRDIYRGLSIKLLLYAPYQAAYMSSYTAMRDAILIGRSGVLLDVALEDAGAVEIRPLTIGEILACAAAAEFGSAAVRVPMEVIKVRIQCHQYTNTWAAIRAFSSAAKVGAVSAQQQRVALSRVSLLFRAQTIAYDLPYSCVQWICYERLKPRIRAYFASFSSGYGDRVDTVFRDNVGPMLAGSSSGVVAAAVTNPGDVLRTRVHLSGVSAGEAARCLMRSEGVRWMGRGLGLRMLWVGSNMGLYFVTFEAMKRHGWN